MIEIPVSYKGLRKDRIALYASLRRWRNNEKRFCNAKDYEDRLDGIYLGGRVLSLGEAYCACCKYEDIYDMCPIIEKPCRCLDGCFKEYGALCDLFCDYAPIAEVRKAVKAICKRIERAITDNINRENKQ